MPAPSSPPVALTVAGSDSSAGAGLQADLKTFSAFGIYGVSAVTCVVAEIPGKVTRIEAIDPDMVRAQIEVLFQGFPIGAAKTGMLYSAETVRATAACFAAMKQTGRSLPLVVDPVMVATSGDPLLRPDAVAAYEHDLFPLAAVLTPNLDEARVLLGEEISDLKAMRRAGPVLAARYGVPVLLKGGHLQGDEAIDLLCRPDAPPLELSAPFTRGVGTHGTGCTYAAGIAAGLARGFDLEAAVRGAKTYVSNAIARFHAWDEQTGAVHALNHSTN